MVKKTKRKILAAVGQDLRAIAVWFLGAGVIEGLLHKMFATSSGILGLILFAGFFLWVLGIVLTAIAEK